MTYASVPLHWLRPGTYRYPGPVTLLGSPAATRYTSTVYREPDGTTCVVIRSRLSAGGIMLAVAVFGSQLALLALMHLVSTWQR